MTKIMKSIEFFETRENSRLNLNRFQTMFQFWLRIQKGFVSASEVSKINQAHMMNAWWISGCDSFSFNGWILRGA